MTVLERTAREAVGSACEEVRDPTAADEVDGVAPLLVARPASTEQVAEVMRAAAAHGLTVVPRGAGTKLSWGLPPLSADLLLDLGGLDRVLDHAAGDLVVATQAGARLATVQETLAGSRQRLAVDETVPGATIGGTLATNASGPRRMLTGTVRDLLIGLTVVRADGVVAKAGGRVVKNVAGYDLGKLVIGSLGTLAVVTEALFRLHPVAEAQRWVSVAAPDGVAEVHRLVQAVVHAQAVPSALEVDVPAAGGGRLDVLLEGRRDGVVKRAATVAALLGEGATIGEEPPARWASYPWQEADVALKLTFVLSGVGDVLASARGVGADLRGSAGTGVVYAALPGDLPTDRLAAAVETLRSACARHGGHAVVVDAPAEVKRAVDVWGPVSGVGLMRRVKDQFDPEHRLSPGRFVGGI
jgi:glycolate dehydrogenase FAD-binding subunit